MKGLSVWVAGLLLSSVWLYIFWPQIFGGQTIDGLDLKLAFLPIETVYQNFQSQGKIPWWVPELGFGHPGIGWGQLGFFVPPHFFLRVLSVQPTNIITFSPVIYTAIGLAGIWMFLRERGLHSLACALGAAVFALNGFQAAHLIHVNFYVATMVLPWLLWALSRLVRSPSLWKSISVAVLAAIMAENGHPPVVIFSFFIAVVFAIGFWFERKNRETILYLALAGVLAFGLAAVRLLPLLEFAHQTGRVSGASPLQAYEFSFPPRHFLALVFPSASIHSTEYAIFVGFIPLMLAVWSLVRFREYRTEKIIGWVLVLLGATLALGKYSPLYRVLVESGVLSIIGGSGRYIYFFLTGVAILSATVLRRGRVALVIAGLAIAQLGYYHHNFYKLQPREAWQAVEVFGKTLREYREAEGVPARMYARRALWQEAAPETRPENSRRTDKLSSMFRVAQPVNIRENNWGCLAIALERASKEEKVQLEIRESLTGPIVRNFESAGEERDGFRDPVFCFEPLAESAGKNFWLVLSSPNPQSLLRLWYVTEENREAQAYFLRGEVRTPQRWEESRKAARVPVEVISVSPHDLQLLLLESHAQAVAGASSARWWGALPSDRYWDFIERFFSNSRTGVDGQDRNILETQRKIFDMAGVTHFSQLVERNAQDKMPEAGFEIIARQAWQGHEAKLYFNPQAFPKVFAVPAAVKVESFDEARLILEKEDFDPKKLVTIEGEVDEKQLPSAGENKASVQIVRYQPERVDITVDTIEPTMLVLTDVASSQWQTRVDGAVAPSLIANGVFRGAVVPAGEHVVTFEFFSPAARWGKAISLTSVGILAILIIVSIWKSRSMKI